MAVLEMGDSFFQRLRTLGGHLVIQDDDLVCSEDTLRQVDDDPIPLISLKGSRRCRSCSPSDREETRIVKVCETEVESHQNVVHEPLIGLGGVAQTEEY
jgi:hypothetical protein